MPKDGPNPEGAVQIVYKEGTPEELAKMPKLGVEDVVPLSKVRAQILEYLRANQGTYQSETEEELSRRRASGATLCNKFLGAVTGSLFSTTLAGMDPRADAIKAGRGGAFHTLTDRPDGPRPGDVVAYGKVEPAPKPGDLRRANFSTVTHVGFFKSRHTGPGGEEIWTVVDGGQPDPGGHQEEHRPGTHAHLHTRGARRPDPVALRHRDEDEGRRHALRQGHPDRLREGAGSS